MEPKNIIAKNNIPIFLTILFSSSNQKWISFPIAKNKSSQEEYHSDGIFRTRFERAGRNICLRIGVSKNMHFGLTKKKVTQGDYPG